MDVLQLTFLGTASAYPTPHRAVSCLALQHDEGIWLFDCGEGSQIQVMKSPLKPGKISKIFITHLHGDHVFGLPGLLCTISQSNQRDAALEVYGPIGLRHFLCTSLHHSHSDLQFKFKVIELATLPCQDPPDAEDWPVEHHHSVPSVPSEISGVVIQPDSNNIWHLFSDDKMTVTAVWLKHRIPSFAFAIQEAEKPGKLDVAKLKQLGVPSGPEYGKLKTGQSIHTPDGVEIKPEDVMSTPVPGRLVVIAGDSCNSSELEKVARNATVLVHEATLENDKAETCVQKGHSTPAMTATLAKECNVKHLILTHFSQRYKPTGAEVKEGESTVDVLVQEAGQIFPVQKILAAYDLMTYTIPRPDKK